MTWDAKEEVRALRRSMRCPHSVGPCDVYPHECHECLAAALQRARDSRGAELAEVFAERARRWELRTSRQREAKEPDQVVWLEAKAQTWRDAECLARAVETGGPPPEPERTQAMRAVSRRVDELAPPRDHWCPVHDNGWLGDKCLCPPAAPQPRVEEPERCGAPSGDSRHQPCTEKAGHGGSHWHPFRPAPSKGSV